MNDTRDNAFDSSDCVPENYSQGDKKKKTNIGKVKEKNNFLEIQILDNTVNLAGYEIFGGVFS